MTVVGSDAIAIPSTLFILPLIFGLRENWKNQNLQNFYLNVSKAQEEMTNVSWARGVTKD